MPGNDILFHGTTGPSGSSDGQSQPDRTLWLGRHRAAETLHAFQSQLTASQTVASRNVLVDSSRIGDGDDAHVFSWIAIQTGPAALAAARVASFDSATGRFDLDRPVGPGSAQSGDWYALFEPGNVFPNVSEAQAAAGDVRYRSIVVRQTHGAAITNARIWLNPLEAFPTALDRFHDDTAGTSAFLQRSDDETDLFLAAGARDPQGGPDNFSGSGPWLHPFGVGIADTLVTSWSNGTRIPIWLRRTIPAGYGPRRSVAVQIIAETDFGGSDPDPLAGSALIVFDVAGGEIAGTLQPDRFVHLGGGCRLLGTATQGGSPLVFAPVEFQIAPGGLGSVHTRDDPVVDWEVTDAEGSAQATFRAPTLPSLEGTIGRVRMRIPDGDEVAQPRPRVTFTASLVLSVDGLAALTIPQASRTYLTDPSDGFEVSQ